MVLVVLMVLVGEEEKKGKGEKKGESREEEEGRREGWKEVKKRSGNGNAKQLVVSTLLYRTSCVCLGTLAKSESLQVTKSSD